MTNLLAVVTSMVLVTNVVETTNEKGCRVCDMIRRNPGITLYHPTHGDSLFIPYEPPTEKTVTTTIKEVHTAKFTWRDQEREVTEEKIISQHVKKWKKREDWLLESEDLNTNPPAPTTFTPSLIFTNGRLIISTIPSNIYFIPR